MLIFSSSKEYQDHRRSTESQARDDAAFARCVNQINVIFIFLILSRSQLSGGIQPQPETRFALQTGQTVFIVKLSKALKVLAPNL